MVTKCRHCGKTLSSRNISAGKEFCCCGCEAAYHALAADTERDTPKSAEVREKKSNKATLLVEGIHCASCIWLIESGLKSQDRVTNARVNMSTRRLSVEWVGDGSIEELEEIIAPIESMGYKLRQLTEDSIDKEQEEQSKFLLKCIALSGFGMGNIMLLSVALWSASTEVMGIATKELFHIISAMIAIPIVILAGRPFFRSAIGALRAGHTNMDVPISLALILACAMSVSETIRHGEYVYFDSAVMLMFFLLIGRYLDLRARGKARESAQALLSMMAGNATVIEVDNDGHLISQRKVPIKELQEGMIVQIAAGEKIPTDGEIIKGESDIDTSLVTGETIPRPVKIGDKIYGGTVNISAPLRMKVLQANEDSLLSEIVRMMEKAEQGNARYVRLADRAAKLYTPVVHTMGAITFLGWMFIADVVWQEALLHAVTVLIITCPCALGLAVPVVQVLASSRLMKKGIMLKSGDALERLAIANYAVFDKTGTVTVGEPILQGEDIIASDIKAAVKKEQEENIEKYILAFLIASHSNHSLSKSLYEGLKPIIAEGDYPLITNKVEEITKGLGKITEVAGKGLEAEYKGGTVRLGSRKWCGDNIAEDSAKRQEDNLLELWLNINGIAVHRFTFIDKLKSDAVEVFSSLKKEGFKLALLSGDRQNVVRSIAESLEIDDYKAEISPIDKCEYIKELQNKGHKVLMVGDGLNDAPSLSTAYVSMSPATGIDITQNTADIVFRGKELKPVLETINTARFSCKLVKENFALAVIYNIIAIPIAVFGYVTPLIAALAMSGSSLIVIANAFRLNFRD